MFPSENKVAFCRIKSLKNNFIKKRSQTWGENREHCSYPLPNSVSPTVSRQTTGSVWVSGPGRGGGRPGECCLLLGAGGGGGVPGNGGGGA